MKRVLTTHTSSSITPKRSTKEGGADGGKWVSGSGSHCDGKGSGCGDNGSGGATGQRWKTGTGGGERRSGNVPWWCMNAVQRAAVRSSGTSTARAPSWHRKMPSRPTEFETELQMIPSVKCALVTDLQGIVLLRAGSSTDEAALQQMAATFALTTDQANKLRLGKAKHFTLCYGALTEGERSACARTHTASHLTPLASPVCPETMTVVHVACSPLVLTLICDRRVAVIAHLQPHPTQPRPSHARS